MNQTTTRPARAAAIARQDEGIQRNVAQIEASKPAASALQLMAERLNVPSATLKSTLLNTVFKGAKDDEFVALVIVANEYQLNPLTKEIYAFPAKGGGIVPLISVDGWISIMNRHPMFDGIEFNDIPDADGNLIAIETVIYRKDRTRPIKVTEYLDECKRNTEPWNKGPARMLRHKSLIQCNRIAFGFSGVFDPDDVEVGDIGPSTGPMPMRDITPQPREERQVARAAIAHDAETGEIDEEVTRELDRQSLAQMDGRTDAQHGDQNATDDIEAALILELGQKSTLVDVNRLMDDTRLDELDEEARGRVLDAADERRQTLRGGK